MRFKRTLRYEMSLSPLLGLPLVNVIMLMVLFAVAAHSGSSLTGIAVGLPRVVTAEAVGGYTASVRVSAQGNVYIDGAVAGDEQFARFLRQVADRKAGLIVYADEAAPLMYVTRVWDLARQAGVARVVVAAASR
jgi:biopolymer transport protein ExbD